MISNYFKIAWRNLKKNKIFSFINVIGLAIGLTCCLLISMYIYEELNYDAHQKLGDRLYQLGTRSKNNGVEMLSGHTPAPMVPAMQQEFLK
jgi:putative ABC transport system permease protein